MSTCIGNRATPCGWDAYCAAEFQTWGIGSMAATWGMDHEPVSQRFLLVQEAASALAVSAMTLYRMIQERQFPAVRLRSRWIIPASAVHELTAGPGANQHAPSPALMDVPAAARLLRVSAQTLYRLIHEDGFPAVWLRGRILVPGSVIDDIAAEAMAGRAAVDPKDWVHAHHSPESDTRSARSRQREPGRRS